MIAPLTQVLILLASSVLFVTLARRVGVPTTLAYLVVGVILGPHALGVVSDSGTTRQLADLGVAFLLFTLGLEFSLPRMLAMRWEVFGLGAALATGRWLLRPLSHEIAHSRLRELFTLAVLLVVLASAWATTVAGLSLALGAFLSGMMLAETEYRHQIEAVIRPFRDILLGVFFISDGMLLDMRVLAEEQWVALATLAALIVLKATVAALVTRPFTTTRFKALRTGIVISIGGEFGVALCTIGLQADLIPGRFGVLLLVAFVLSMVLSPFILNNNKAVARFLLREKGPPVSSAREG